MCTSSLSGLACLFNEELGHVSIFIDAHLSDHIDKIKDCSNLLIQLISIINL